MEAVQRASVAAGFSLRLYRLESLCHPLTAKWFQSDPGAPVADPSALAACNYHRDKVRKDR